MRRLALLAAVRRRRSAGGSAGGGRSASRLGAGGRRSPRSRLRPTALTLGEPVRSRELVARARQRSLRSSRHCRPRPGATSLRGSPPRRPRARSARTRTSECALVDDAPPGRSRGSGRGREGRRRCRCSQLAARSGVSSADPLHARRHRRDARGRRPRPRRDHAEGCRTSGPCRPARHLRSAAPHDPAERRAAAKRGFDVRLAETGALAHGYARILSPSYRSQRGVAASERLDAALAGSRAPRWEAVAPRSSARSEPSSGSWKGSAPRRLPRPSRRGGPASSTASSGSCRSSTTAASRAAASRSRSRSRRRSASGRGRRRARGHRPDPARARRAGDARADRDPRVAREHARCRRRRSRRRPGRARLGAGGALARPDRRALPRGVEGGGRRRRLRRDRSLARPARERRRGGKLEPRGAGSAGGVRDLRARPGAAAARHRALAVPAHRRAVLVRRRRPRRTRPAREAEGRRPGAGRVPRGPRRRARRCGTARRNRGGLHRRRHLEQRNRGLSRRARGGADPRRADGQHGRRQPQVPAAAADRRRRRVRRVGGHLGGRADGARLARALRREARGGRLGGRDRGAPADPQLVLPPRLLGRASRRLPPAQAAAAPRRGRRARHRADPRSRRTRLLERLPRRVRDRSLPPGDHARGRDARRAARCGARPRGDPRRRRSDDPARAQAAAPQDADRDRCPDDLGARDPRRDDRPDVPGRRLAARVADRGRAPAVLGRDLARHLPHLAGGPWTGRRGHVRGRQLPRRGARARPAPAAECSPPSRPPADHAAAEALDPNGSIMFAV